MRFGLAAALAAILTMLPHAAASQTATRPAADEIERFAGEWAGRMERGGTEAQIRVRLTAENGRLLGTFDWPALGYLSADVLGVRIEGNQIRIGLPLPVGSLRLIGARSGGALTGTLEEVNLRANQWVTLPAEGRFRVERAISAGTPYRIEPVRFANGGVLLAGEIYMPRRPNSVPGVVFVHGSGPSGRSDGAFYADRLARAGIAVLVYDKRGVAASGGDWRDGGYEELAGDAHAALLLLRGRDGVDAARLGYVGRSEGAWVVPLAVARGGSAFAGFISGPAVSVADEDIDHYRIALIEAGYGEAEIEAATALLRLRHDVIAGRADQARLAEEALRLRAMPWFATMNWDDGENASLGRFRARTIRYDPAQGLRTIGVPSYWLYGTDDRIIPVADSIARLFTLRVEPRPTIVVLPRADHALAVTDYPRLPGQVARAADLVAGWINDGADGGR